MSFIWLYKRNDERQAKFSSFVWWWKQFLSLKNCPSVRICSVLIRSNRDTTVYYRLIFCAFSWPNMVKWCSSTSGMIMIVNYCDTKLWYQTRVKFSPWRDGKAEVSRVSLSSEQSVRFIITLHLKSDPYQLVWFQIYCKCFISSLIRLHSYFRNNIFICFGYCYFHASSYTKFKTQQSTSMRTSIKQSSSAKVT